MPGPTTPIDAFAGLARNSPGGARQRLKALFENDNLTGFCQALDAGIKVDIGDLVRLTSCAQTELFLRQYLQRRSVDNPRRFWKVVIASSTFDEEDTRMCCVGLEHGIPPPENVLRRLWSETVDSCNRTLFFHLVRAGHAPPEALLGTLWKDMQSHHNRNEALLELWLSAGLPVMPHPQSPLLERCRKHAREALPKLFFNLAPAALAQLEAKIRKGGELAFLREVSLNAEGLWRKLALNHEYADVAERMALFLKWGVTPPERIEHTHQGRGKPVVEQTSWPTFFLATGSLAGFEFLVDNPRQAALFAEDSTKCPRTFSSRKTPLLMPECAIRILHDAGVNVERRHRGGNSFLHDFCRQQTAYSVTRLKPETLELLQAHGRHMLSATNREGHTPLQMLETLSRGDQSRVDVWLGQLKADCEQQMFQTSLARNGAPSPASTARSHSRRL
jgi:hypothetical protein